MLKTKQQLTVLIFGIFLFAGAILSTTAFAQDYQNSPFSISIAGFLSNNNYTQSLEYMKQAGASRVRFMSKWGGLIWAKIETQKGQYDWSLYDEYFLSAKEKGLDIMVNIYSDIPDWSTQDEGCVNEYPEGELMNEYVAFIQNAAERYDGDGIDDAPESPKVNCWILGVELERLDTTWCCFSAEEYADLFVKTYEALKSANPNATVMSYGCNLAMTWGYNTFTKPWLENLDSLTSSNPNFEFIYSMHYYPSDTFTLIDYITKAQNLLIETNFTETTIAITDMGMWVKKAYLLEHRKKVAINMIKAYVQSFAHNVNTVVWAQIADGGDSPASYEAGLISKDTMRKNHIFYSYKFTADKLEGSDWGNVSIIRENNMNDSIYIYKFINEDNPIWVAWSDNGEKTVTINVEAVTTVKTTEVLSNVYLEQDLNENDYPEFFTTEKKQVANNTVSLMLGEIPVFVEEISNTSIEETGYVTPNEFQLNQNYPNPFNPQTTISYQLPVNSDVALKIYNMLGQEVRTLINENKLAGYHSVVWNGTDNSGRQVSSGVYFYQVKAGNNFSEINKMLLIK